MNPPSSREEELFAAALARPAEERAAFLQHACGGDDELRRRIDALLQAHDSDGSPLDALPGEIAAAARPTESPGDWIGRYKLLQQIGEGGCGIVFMAEQETPVRRRVALKIVKRGMDTREVIARFEAERQALAMMEHPNIARVLDAGATDAGRPFFVMELVRGIPITRHCDENNLSPAARLSLFTSVCHAVQHAHQKGVIHRDLKPSNILVTLHDGVAVPKVIDFGIAKATQGRLTDATLFTAFEQFIGTPAYMSPEQAELSGLDIDTRSDVYSLGVLLYELLTGRPPFDPKTLVQTGLDEIRRIIREVEPPRPSTCLSTLADGDRSTVARLRGTVPSQLTTLLRGDLDWIVMRCLEKNRARRYQTAGDLAADLQRHLANEPVSARAPGTAYVLGKLLRRHRLAFGTAAAVLLALCAGLAVSTWQAVRATRAERLADARLQSELAAREEAEDQRRLAVARLEAEQAARRETEHQKHVAEQERNRAQAAERLAAERLDAEFAARREAERQEALANEQRALAEQERNRAREAEQAAQAEAARTAEAARLMQNMLRGVGPHVALVRDRKRLHEILDRQARNLLEEAEPAAAVRLRDALTAVYYALGNYVASTALGGRWPGKDRPPLAPALAQLGLVLRERGSAEDADTVLGEAAGIDRLLSVTGDAEADVVPASVSPESSQPVGSISEAARDATSLVEKSR